LQDNPTVRIYDFGRRPGEYPELGFRLVDPAAGLRLVPPVQVGVADGHAVEVLVATPYFVKSRVRLAAGHEAGLAPLYGGYRVLHCLEGQAVLSADGQRMALSRGETAFVPACLEEALRLSANGDCVLFDDALPRLEALTGLLGRRGASTDAIEALLAPPRALE
jgi:mannose-6-phosphate isomerase class I